MSEQAATPAPAAPASTPAPAPAPVPAAQSPTGTSIPTATPAKPAASLIPAPQVSQQSKVLSARAALGLPENPSNVVKGMAKELKARVDQTSIKLPPKAAPTPEAAPETPETPETPTEIAPVAKEEPKAQQAPETPEPKQQAAPVEDKITIDGKEYTKQELAEMLKAKEAPKPETPEPKAQQQQQRQQAQAVEPPVEELERQYMEDAIPRYSMTEEEIDTMLSGGPEAVEQVAKILAKTELNTRKWMEQQLNPIFEQIHAQIAPVAEQYAQVQQYQQEAAFKAAHPDLATRTDLVRTVAQGLMSKFPNEVARMTPEQFHNEVATHARNVLKRMGVDPAATPAAPGAAPAAPAKAATPPPPAARVGGTPSPQKPNAQRAMALDVINFG